MMTEKQLESKKMTCLPIELGAENGFVRDVSVTIFLQHSSETKGVAATGFAAMPIKTNRFNPLIMILTIFFVIATVAYPTKGLEPRKLDESTAPGDQGIKCNPSCVQSPPPPSPPPPCPPPPALPPPPPKKTPTQYCPPPPLPPSPPSFIYITGPPGNQLYPVDQGFGGANKNLQVGLLALVSGFLIQLVF
ncbi:hypothetical protein PTKIN_Ptkin17bG0110300 [Pterospermum kingtungense]